MPRRTEQQVRQAQMNALDRLPKSLRELIYYAPVNYDPRAVLKRKTAWGTKRTLAHYQREIKDVLWELNYLKFRN